MCFSRKICYHRVMKTRKKPSTKQTQQKNFIAKFKKLPLWIQIVAPICFGAILIFGVVNFYEFGRQKEWWGYSDEAKYLAQHEIFRWENENLKTKFVNHPPIQGLLGMLARMGGNKYSSTLGLHAKKGQINNLYNDFLKYLKNSGWKIDQSDTFTVKAAKLEGNFNLRIEITLFNSGDEPYIKCEVYILRDNKKG